MRKITRRRVDELGHIILPVEARKLLGLEFREELDIFVHGNEIILKRILKDTMELE